MPITRQPGDEGATVTRNTDGESTDVADGGFPAIKAYNVIIHVDASTNSGSCTADDPGTAAVVMALEWTDDSGGSWNFFDGAPSDVLESLQAINGGSDSSSGWPGAATAVATVGTVTDLSQIQVRARVTNTFTGAGTGTGTATMTDWEITHTTLGAIIEA